MGAFVNDVTQISRISDPLSLLCHAKIVIFLTTLLRLSHKSKPPLPPSCVTSFMNGPFELTMRQLFIL